MRYGRGFIIARRGCRRASLARCLRCNFRIRAIVVRDCTQYRNTVVAVHTHRLTARGSTLKKKERETRTEKIRLAYLSTLTLPSSSCIILSRDSRGGSCASWVGRAVRAHRRHRHPPRTRPGRESSGYFCEAARVSPGQRFPEITRTTNRKWRPSIAIETSDKYQNNT